MMTLDLMKQVVIVYTVLGLASVDPKPLIAKFCDTGTQLSFIKEHAGILKLVHDVVYVML